MTTTLAPRPTEPVILDVVGDGLFDILDPFRRVFWKDMDRSEVLNAMRGFGSMYQVVPATGMPYGTKVKVAA
jgi:hypothetical protein